MEVAERDRNSQAACKSRFETAMANAQNALSAELAPKPAEQAATPAPTAAPAVVAAAPKMVAGPRLLSDNYIFFDWDSARLSSTGNELVAAMARALRAKPYDNVRIVGHTDTSGATDYNYGLSLGRAIAVRDELVRNGVSASKVRVEAVGETDSAVSLGDGVREARNRRVLVSYDVEGPMVVSSN